MILKDNGGSMNQQVAAIRSRLVSELFENTNELYENEPPENFDMDDARAHWESLNLNDLKDEHRRIKVLVEVYRAAKSQVPK